MHAKSARVPVPAKSTCVPVHDKSARVPVPVAPTGSLVVAPAWHVATDHAALDRAPAAWNWFWVTTDDSDVSDSSDSSDSNASSDGSARSDNSYCDRVMYSRQKTAQHRTLLVIFKKYKIFVFDIDILFSILCFIKYLIT